MPATHAPDEARFGSLLPPVWNSDNCLVPSKSFLMKWVKRLLEEVMFTVPNPYFNPYVFHHERSINPEDHRTKNTTHVYVSLDALAGYLKYVALLCRFTTDADLPVHNPNYGKTLLEANFPQIYAADVEEFLKLMTRENVRALLLADLVTFF